MNAILWERVRDLTHRALDLPPAERRRLVETEAGADEELRLETWRLLSAHDQAHGFLDVPLIAAAGAAAAVRDALPPSPDELVLGSELGPYRILGVLGRGGMGTVYRAVRVDDVFEKTVAIKIAAGGPGREGHRELFARERHVLAALDHPGIARVLDGGETPAGLLYLVMEYVDGVPIDRACDARRLGARARLRIFLDVCAAVQYAHHRLVVHRDIKPANVLADADGHVRLLDFGIAKLLVPGEARTASPGQTATHAWTPETASPEQVRGEPASVATDVYGLGALLYRLLTSRPVFDLGDADQMERSRIVCEDVPRAPSVAGTADGVSHRDVAGDLDLIVLKALQKDPARRYRSATHLAEDVERYLAHLPVLAVPDSWRYRSRKFVGRHPMATLATATALVAVLGASSVALWQARRADAERDRSRARLADVRRLASTLIFDVYDRVENSPNATEIRRSLVEKGLEYLAGFAGDAQIDLSLSLELAEAYRRLALVQGGGNANLGDRDGALASLARGRDLLTPFRGPGDAPLAVEILDLRIIRQMTPLFVDEPDRRRALAAEAVERADRLSLRFPGRAEVTEAQAHGYFFAALAARQGEQIAQWTTANRGYAALVELAPGETSHLRNLALTEKYLGAAYATTLQTVDARTHFERALALDRRLQALSPNSRLAMLDVAIDLGSLGTALTNEEPPRLGDAKALFLESLGIRERAAELDPNDVFARQGIGFCLVAISELCRRLDEIEPAVDYAKRATDVYASLPAAGFVTRRGQAWLALGRAESAAGRRTEGCGAYRRARADLSQAAAAESDVLQAEATRSLESLSEALRGCAP